MICSLLAVLARVYVIIKKNKNSREKAMNNYDDELLKKRFIELSERAYSRGIYTYSPFLSLAEQDLLTRIKKSLFCSFQLYGGYEGAERQVARFGSGETARNDGEYPIVCVKASPKSAKFSDELSHRDFLGALMSLGIKRELIGDIVVADKTGYIFCLEKSAAFLTENLVKIRHTDIVCEISDADFEVKPPPEETTVVIASERIDSIIAAVFSLSRSAAQECIEKGIAFVNSALVEKLTFVPEKGDIISVRGHGRFIYEGTVKSTKKGRLLISVRKYE